MNYQHLIFDVDGTLLNTREADLKSLKETVVLLKNKLPDINQLLFALSLSSKDALKQLQIENIDQGIDVWRKNRQKYKHTIRLFDGIACLIKQLQIKGIHLGIITSKSKIEYENDFISFEISSVFKTAICLEDTLSSKPSPAPLFSYLQKNEISKEKVLYIGDNLSDAICSTQAGIDFALALWGNPIKNIQKTIQANYYVDQPMEILSLV